MSRSSRESQNKSAQKNNGAIIRGNKNENMKVVSSMGDYIQYVDQNTSNFRISLVTILLFAGFIFINFIWQVAITWVFLFSLGVVVGASGPKNSYILLVACIYYMIGLFTKSKPQYQLKPSIKKQNALPNLPKQDSTETINETEISLSNVMSTALDLYESKQDDNSSTRRHKSRSRGIRHAESHSDNSDSSDGCSDSDDEIIVDTRSARKKQRSRNHHYHVTADSNNVMGIVMDGASILLNKYLDGPHGNGRRR